MSNFFELLENGEDISSAVSKVFDVEFGSDKYNQILNDIESSFGTTLLDLGQKVDKFTNTIDSFYEKAST